MKVKSESEVAQSCPTLSDPVDCSLPCGGYKLHPSQDLKLWTPGGQMPLQGRLITFPRDKMTQ